MFRLYCISIIIVLSFEIVFAQKDTLTKPVLILNIDNLNFVKNNEYFNNIADGYTLLGSQLHPKLTFYPHPKTKLELGVFGLTYAGLNRYHKIIPTFSFTYKMKNSELIMGTLQNDKSHRLIAPLMSFENTLKERSIENGLQYILKTNKLFFDTWLNWEEFIFKKDTKSEEFVMGISADYTILNSDNWHLMIPFQNTFYHRGGQINTNEISPRETFTMRHTALGLDLIYLLQPNQSIEAKSFYIQHQSTSTPSVYLFDTGYGWLSRVHYNYKNWKLEIGYWYGDKFVSPRGDDMFQSVSTKTNTHYVDEILQETYTNHTEPIRSLLLGNICYQKELVPNVQLGFRFNSYYQNYYSNPTPNNISNSVNNHLDYSLGLYIRYSDYFSILQ